MVVFEKEMWGKTNERCFGFFIGGAAVGQHRATACHFFAKSARKKNGNKKNEDFGTEGMALGMCFGTAIATSLGNNTGIGLTLGMLAGLVIGSCIEKKKNDAEK